MDCGAFQGFQRGRAPQPQDVPVDQDVCDARSACFTNVQQANLSLRPLAAHAEFDALVFEATAREQCFAVELLWQRPARGVSV